MFIWNAVEHDREFLFIHTPAKGEPAQAHQHMGYRLLSKLLFSHSLTDHLLHRVAIMVDPEATILAQSDLNVDELIFVREANVNFTEKRRRHIGLSYRVTY